VTARNINRRPLTDLQQAILDVIWSRGPSTAEDVRTALRPRHRLADSTIRTLLRRLEGRGFLSHDTVGQVFVYRATVAQGNVAARAVQHIIDRFCAGSVERFLTGMVDEKILTPAAIERLARKIRKQR
jgi:predicted transcriptional regulator